MVDFGKGCFMVPNISDILINYTSKLTVEINYTSDSTPIV